MKTHKNRIQKWFAVLGVVLLPVMIIALVRGDISSKSEITVGDSGHLTLDAILADAAVTTGTVVVPAGTHTLNASRTLKAGLNLRVLRGGVIAIPNRYTLTINGTIEAGQYQIFSWVGTGTVAFGKNCGVTDIWVRWFGATGNGVTDDTAAIQKAITCAFGLGYSKRVLGSAHDVYLTEELTINANTDCSVFCGNGAKLLQKTNNNVITVTNPGGGLLIEHWRITGVGSPPSYAGYGITASGTNLRVQFCEIEKFNRCLNMASLLYSDFQNLVLTQCVHAIYGYDSGLSPCNVNSFHGIRISTTYGDAIKQIGGLTNVFDRITCEGTQAGLFNFDSVQSTVINNVHCEGSAANNTTTYAFLFKACKNISVTGSELAVGGGSAFDSVFRFTGICYGINVTRNNILGSGAAVNGLYSTDGTGRAFKFYNNTISVGYTTKDAVPLADLYDNDYASGCVVLSPEKVRMKFIPSVNYNQNPLFTNVISTSAEHNCTGARDLTTGYGVSKSFKVTPSGAGATIDINPIYSGAPASGFFVMSFAYKSDIGAGTTANIQTLNTCGTGSLFPICGDGNWRKVFCHNATTASGSPSVLRVATAATSGNIWISDLRLYWFATHDEANVAMGCLQN